MTTTLPDLFVAEVRRRFAGRSFRVDADSATFPAAHPDVGDARVWWEGDELGVEVGRITHGHFACYDEDVADVERVRRTVEQVIDFLSALFADRVLLWHSPGPHPRSGGWAPLLPGKGVSFMGADDVTYFWSGPTPNPRADRSSDDGPRAI